jgi:hypothetical protein
LGLRGDGNAFCVREHWRELAFWRWWWTNRAPAAVRLGLGLLLLGVVLAGGLLAANRISSAKGGVQETDVLGTYVETTDKQVTVREQGRTVRKIVPVVHVRKVEVRVLSKPQTVLRTHTSFQPREVTIEGRVRTVRQKVVRRVPVVRTQVVASSGKTQTVAVTQFKPTTAIETRAQTVTNSKTVTNTDTEVHLVTTVQTRTQTVQNTVTETDTVTETNTVTETQPAITVEVTVPVPVTVTVTTPRRPPG